MQFFLVVIDTTHMPFDVRGFKGLQNFYFCLAPDEKAAKNLILSTFKNNPGAINKLINCVYATSLTPVLKLLKPNDPLWSYIPIGGKRAPGQQKRIPTPESLLDPATLNLKDDRPIISTATDVRGLANKTGIQGVVPLHPPVLPPKLFEEQVNMDHVPTKIEIDAKSKAKGDSALDMLLNDPVFKAKLMAKLLGEAAPTTQSSPVADDEAGMRFNDEGSYDDSLTSIVPPPSNIKVPLEQLEKQANNIPASTRPDQATLQRIRSNIKPSDFQIVD